MLRPKLLPHSLSASRRTKRHRIAIRKWKLRCCPLSARLAVFLRPCGCCAGGATGLGGRRPDRLKLNENLSSIVWILPPRGSLVPAPIAVFRFGDERAICRLLIKQGVPSSPLDRRENALLPRRREFPSIEPLGGSRKSLPKKRSEPISSLASGRTRSGRLANLRVAPAYGIRCGPTVVTAQLA